MAWIESHQEIENHPKLSNLISLTQKTRNECIGILHRLWWWSLNYAEDGNLNKYTVGIIAASLGTDEIFYTHLITAGWIDKDNFIHDWWDYAGRFLQVRYKHKPENWQKIKHLYDKRKNSPKNSPKNRHSVGSKNNKPNLTIPNQPNQPISVVNEKIAYDWSTFKFININGKKELYAQKFPALDIENEIRKMEAWLQANPANRKSNYDRFIVNWLMRSQDRAAKKKDEYL